MPPQSVEVAETIAALKRALRREKEAPAQQQISSATNRGNKLKRGANFVHAGSLPYRYTKHGYKEKVEHAGYQRYILSRNPKRYNEYGDELEESESDEEADADAEDENPYSQVKLEELLRPLTHPSELAAHPTLSQVYLDPALPEMVQTTEEKLRQERANLWRAKNLHRHFIGDESWMPCLNVEQASDWDLFDPLASSLPQTSPSKKRKRDSDIQAVQDGTSGPGHKLNTQEDGLGLSDSTLVNGNGRLDTQPDQKIDLQEHGNGNSLHLDGGMKEVDGKSMSDPENDTMVEDQKTSQDHEMGRGERHEAPSGDTAMEVDMTETDENRTTGTADHSGDTLDAEAANGTIVEGDGEAGEESPPPPPRRITRALAANNTSNTATPPLSPISSTGSLTDVDSMLLQPHPMYLLPAAVQIAHSTHQHSNLPLHVAHSGLPIDEILETRRLLGMYIQKQEETIRGLEGVLGKLIKAKRMRARVYEYCKAEGHVGEWSDGEDWVDTEFWGIDPGELKKGKDDDNNEEEEIGRKGKRRRGRERE